MSGVADRRISDPGEVRPRRLLGAPARRGAPAPVLALLLALAGPTPGAADRLPTRLYDSTDGLPADSTVELIIDRDGYIWSSSGSFVTRFDGAEFERFGAESGLGGDPQGLAQTPDGTIWVATTAGLEYVATSGEPAIRSLAIDSPIARQAIADLCVLPSGDLVVAVARAGIYAVGGAPAQPSVRRLAAGRGAGDPLFTVDCDRHGTVWASYRSGILGRIAPDGRVDEIPLDTERPANSVRHAFVDRFGHLWAASWNGLFVGDAHATSATGLFRRRLEQIAGRPILFATGIIETHDGSIVIAASGGLLRVEPQPDLAAPLPAEWIAKPEGLDALELASVREDARHDLWASDRRRGLWHVTIDGVRAIAEPEVLHDAYITTLHALSDGTMVAVGNRIDSGPEGRVIQVWDGRSWSEHPFPRSPGQRHLGWGSNQVIAADARGTLWFAGGQGLLGYRAGTPLRELRHDRPDDVLTGENGLPEGQVFRVWRDREGLLYLTLFDEVASHSIRFDPLARTVWPTRLDNWPETGTPTPMAYVEDPRGAVWIAVDRGVGRPLAPGHWEYIPLPAAQASLPPASFDVAFDAEGALWVASGAGVVRAVRPLDPAPRFERVWPRSDNAARGAQKLLALPDGRMLAGTAAGVVLFDRRGGVVREYGVDSGLPAAEANALALDSGGRVWVGTARGIALLPALDKVTARAVPDPMLVRVATPLRRVAIDRRGQPVLTNLTLQPTERSLDVWVRAIQTQPDQKVLYRTRLEGLDRDWSLPSPQRQLRIAGLSPGSYRLRIRAEDQTGAVSEGEARIDFMVRAEFYQRPWFLAAVVGALALAALAWQRQAARRRLAVERTRTTIATDLHDDVGAGLSQIAVLSEKLARERGASRDGPAAEDDSPTHIAEIARRLVDRMSDLVWAINPERDRVFSLGQRMRRFATPLLRARGVALHLSSIDEEHDRALSGDVRRELLLAFQELVNNAVKHSGCTRVDAALAIEAGRIVLTVADDGQGFDPGAAAEGMGLGSIRGRAERLGGRCRIETSPGGGVRVQISAPLRR